MTYVKKPLQKVIAKPPKQKESIFFLTINTLQVEYSMAKLKKIIEDWYESPMFESFIRYREEGKGSTYLDEISLKFGVERGHKLHRVHAHIVITVRHRTMIHMNLEKIRAYFKEELELEDIHLDIKWVKGREDVDQYIYKYLHEEE